MIWRLIAALTITLGMAGAATAQDTACAGRDLISALDAPDAQTLRDTLAGISHPEGLLWRATRGDTVIDIFGTYHFRHRETDAHLNMLTPLITAADKVYLEISNADQSEMQAAMGRDPSIMFLTEGPTLIDLLEEDDWTAYANAMQARGIPSFMAAKFKPLWATMMLGMGPCEMASGALNAEGIDTLVGEIAEAGGNPSRSLEDYRDMLGLLDASPMEDQLDLIRLSLAWPGDTDDLSYTIRERYLAGQTALIWEFSRFLSIKHGGPEAEAEFATLTETFLDHRNRAWIDRLMAETKAGDRLFLAFGAGHLPGETGILSLLGAEGFSIERQDLTP